MVNISPLKNPKQSLDMKNIVMYTWVVSRKTEGVFIILDLSAGFRLTPKPLSREVL